MHPYRPVPPCPGPALRCVDTDSCAPPRVEGPPRSLRAAGAVALLGAAAAVGAAAHASLSRHVDIEPQVLERAVRTPAPPRTFARAVQSAPAVPAALHLAGAFALLDDRAGHDPKRLLARARAVAEVVDVTIVEVRLSPDVVADLSRGRGLPAETVPVYSGERVSGIQVRGIDAGSPLRACGLENGDIVVSINGYRLDDGTFFDLDPAGLQRHGHLVLELLRDSRRIILSVTWPPTP